MAATDDRSMAVARVYTDAMLDLAEARGQEDELGDELAALAEVYRRDPQFERFVSSPLVDAEEREASLERMLRGRASDLLVDSLQVMNRKGRLGLLPAVAESYRHTLYRRRGRVEVQVASAVELSEANREQLRQAIHRRTGRDPVLEVTVDPSLIGGLVVRIGDQKIDASVATQLENLSQTLLTRAAREVGSGAYVEEGRG